MSCKDILQERGWFLKDEFIEELIKHSKRNPVETVIQDALNRDLKEICKVSSEPPISGNINEIKGPLVLQIQKTKNVLVPAKVEELGIGSGKKFLAKMHFTDGTRSIPGIVFQPIPRVDDGTPPGTKIRIVGKVRVVRGFLLLDKTNVDVLGGRVEKMIESWNLKKSLASFDRNHKTEGEGPPPFVPFNQRGPRPQRSSRDDFKPSTSNSNPKPSKENEAFAVQRKATIEAAMKENNRRPNEKVLNDQQLAELMQMGFSLEDSVEAGRASRGNLVAAINILTNAR